VATQTRAETAPPDSLEPTLQTIWEDVLQVRPIGWRAKFFALGGHSLLAVRLLARIETQLGVALPVAVLFQNPTIEQLAQRLREKRQDRPGNSLIEVQAGNGGAPLLLVHGVGGGMMW